MRLGRLGPDGRRSDKGSENASAGLCAVILRAANLVTFFSFFVVGLSQQTSRAEDLDFSSYSRAVEFCRGNVKRPMALDFDKRVLCFDGVISPDLDVSLANDLTDGGLFVVRSLGGDRTVAVKLAEVLRERHAVVVVSDYCLSACASYLLVASTTAFVLRDTLVAWQYPIGTYGCPSFVDAKDGGPKRLEGGACPDAPAEYQSGYKYYKQLDDWFYSTRTIDTEFEDPPESVIVRRILRSKFEGIGTYPPNLLWTWNPRYYASAIKTKIIYETYPQSQDEVDAMAARLQVRVIYDP